MRLRERVICADGFSMSVQAHDGAYCTPRVDDAERYTAVEVGFPSRTEPLLMQWCEAPERPTETVYAWVPSQTVSLVLAAHGGIVSGEVPPGVPHLRAERTDGS